ncbi:MAG: tetratricopeptide repeat protein [Alphaproteobacteria bacterium]
MSFPQNSQQNEPIPVEQTLAEAVTHHQAGRLVEAERLYRVVIKAAPHHIAALYRLGILCFQDGRLEQGIPFLEDVLKLQPQNIGILNSLGVALQQAGRDKDAVMRFRQALEINPTYIDALNNLGKALRDQGNAKVALEYFVQAEQLSPDNPDISIDIGRCYFEMGSFPEAILYFEKALKQKPDYIDALSALGTALLAAGRRIEARAKLERALQIEPNDAKLVLNFGEFLAFDEGKIDEALGYFNRALTLAPEYNNALWRKSFALLAKGEYREGWKLYAACLGGRDTRGFNKFAPMQVWDGDPGPNKRLLIWCEQGLGDSLQFIRYAELCKQRVGKVSVFCQKPLVRLFKNLPYIDDASDVCDRSSFDEHVPIMNLPHVFDTLVETVPAAPYLRIDPEITAKWATRFADADILKVGLVWAGGAHEENVIAKLTNLQRSIALERMKPWFNVLGIKFYSLQKDKPAEQIAASGLADRLTNFMDDVADFTDTGAIIQNLDLVITVDTSVAHLAGGLGKPVWIMSRYNADWRWLQNRPSNPWYPSARIFGQPTMGDWDGVIKEVEQALRLEIAKQQRR